MGENTLEDVKVKEKQSITLTCEVTGKGLSSCTSIIPPLHNYSFPRLRIRVEKTSSCCNVHLKLNFIPAYRNVGRSLLGSMEIKKKFPHRRERRRKRRREGRKEREPRTGLCF